MVVRFQPSWATTLSIEFGLAELLDLEAVESGVAGVAGLVEEAELHDAVGTGVGEGIDEDGVNDGEDGACGADAEGEGEHGGEDEAGALAKFASGVLEVGEDRLHAVAPGDYRLRVRASAYVMDEIWVTWLGTKLGGERFDESCKTVLRSGKAVVAFDGLGTSN